MKSELEKLWKRLKDQRKREVACSGALMVISAISEMLAVGAMVPFLTALTRPREALLGNQIFNGISVFLRAEPNVRGLICASLLFGATALAASGLRVKAYWESVKLANNIASDLSIELYKAMLYKPYIKHLEKNSSEIISNIACEVDQVAIMMYGILQFTNGLMLSGGIIVVLLIVDVKMTIIMSCILASGYIAIVGKSKSRMEKMSQTVLEDQVRLVKKIQEGIGGIRDVILGEYQQVYLKEYESADVRLRRHRSVSQLTTVAPRYAMEGVCLAAIAGSTLLLALVKGDFMTIVPMLGALALGAQKLIPAFQLLYSNWSDCILNVPALYSIQKYIDEEKAEMQILKEIGQKKVKKIQAKDIWFRYSDKDSWVLKGINFTIEKGETLGIMGETGCGKSTLLDIVMGLIEPVNGCLVIDGEALKWRDIMGWRKKISHVPQQVYLRDTSIAENIALGVKPEEIDMDRVCWSGSVSMLSDFVDSLRDGYKSTVGERGVRLSGGQRQRIGIARALYREAEILILDEATSALDRETEDKIMRSLERISGNMMIIVVAHRLSALERCDRLLEIKGGQIRRIR